MIFCDCHACERKDDCPHFNHYDRLPKEYFTGASSLCPKLKEGGTDNE